MQNAPRHNNTNSTQVGLVVQNGELAIRDIQDRLELLGRPDASSYFKQIYPMPTTDDQLSIVRGEVLWTKTDAPLSVYSQYPRVFSSFNGMAVRSSKLTGQNGEDDEERTLNVLDDTLMVVGIAQNDIGFNRANKGRGLTPLPSIQIGGVGDVMVTGDQTIYPGDWIIARVPRPYGAKFRRAMTPGIDPNKQLCEVMPYDPSHVRPTILLLQKIMGVESFEATTKDTTQMTRRTAATDLAKTLREFMLHIAAETVLQFSADANAPMTDAAAVAYVRGTVSLAKVNSRLNGARFDKFMAHMVLKTSVAGTTEPSLKKWRDEGAADLVACLNESVMRDNSRILGVALSKAEKGQYVSCHLKQPML